MLTLTKRFWHDEGGFIVSAALVLITTLGVLGMIVGINSVATAINSELNDISSAFGAIDQSYWYSGLVKWGHSGVPGSAYADARDFCDCTTIVPVPPAVKGQYYVPPAVVPPQPVPHPGPHAVPHPGPVKPPCVHCPPPHLHGKPGPHLKPTPRRKPLPKSHPKKKKQK